MPARTVAVARGNKIRALPGTAMDFRANRRSVGAFPAGRPLLGMFAQVRALNERPPVIPGRPAKGEALESLFGPVLVPAHRRIPALFNYPEGGRGLAHH